MIFQRPSPDSRRAQIGKFTARTGGVLCLLAALQIATPALAQSGSTANPAAPGQQTAQPAGAQPNWAVGCTEAKDNVPGTCRMAQNIVVQQSGQRLLTVLVEPRKGAPNHALVLVLPHGLFLPSGAQVQVDDGQPVSLPIQTSDANGAYAGTAISDELLASLKKGETLKIGFQSAQRQPVVVPVTLIGFTSAYVQLAH